MAFYIYLIAPALVLPLWSIDPIAGATTALIGTACIGLVLTNNLVHARYIAYAMLAAAFTNVIALILGIDTGHLTSEVINETRLTGLLGNANVLAINFSLPAMAVWLIPGRIPLSVRLVSLIVTFYGIYVSGSRKGVILGGALLMIVAKRLTDNLSRFKQIAVFGTVLTISAAYYQYLGDVFDRLNDNVLAINRFSRIFSGWESSFSERKWLIEKGYQIWERSPLFGEGLGQFASISGFGAYSHNNYIEILVSGGIIAFLLYYMLYALVIYSAYKFHRNELFYAVFVIATLLVIDTAAVTFSGRSTMLFVAFTLSHFTEKSQHANPIITGGRISHPGGFRPVQGTSIRFPTRGH
jgi:O-antigen ligase